MAAATRWALEMHQDNALLMLKLKKKTVETRDYPLPQQLLHNPIAVIKSPATKHNTTGFKHDKVQQATAIGCVVFKAIFKYTNLQQWTSDKHRHQAPPEYTWDGHGEKWGWEVAFVEYFEAPVIVENLVRHKRSIFSLCPSGAPLPKCTWKSFWVVGVLFPLHIVAGLISIPLLMLRIYQGNFVAIVMLLAYMPYYLQAAHYRYPGWKGFESFWAWAEYDKTGQSYFGALAVHGSVSDSSRQYIVAIHPHGCLIFQRIFWRTKLMDTLFKRPWRMIAASALFYIPIIREMSLWFGAVDASKSMCRKVLQAGANLILYPGGLDEANRSSSDSRVTLKVRAGFIRLAVEHGIPVVPAFTFGELETIRSVTLLPYSFADFLKRNFRVSSNIFVGRRGCPIPFRTPLHMCIGKPILTRQIAPGSKEMKAEVERVHMEYCEELSQVYERNKSYFGYADRVLVFE